MVVLSVAIPLTLNDGKVLVVWSREPATDDALTMLAVAAATLTRLAAPTENTQADEALSSKLADDPARKVTVMFCPVLRFAVA
jgi:hypothetical protein